MIERLLIVYCGAYGSNRRSLWRSTIDHQQGGTLDGRRSAAAVFRREGASWRCVRAVPALAPLVGMPPAHVTTYLAAHGHSHAWAARFEVP